MPFKLASFERNTARQTLPGAFAVATLAGAHVIDWQDGTFLALDPGGAARAVTLPTPAASDRGAFIVIANRGEDAENLTVNSDLCVIAPNTTQVVFVNAAGAWAAWGLV